MKYNADLKLKKGQNMKMKISEINLNCIEGRLLIAAISTLTSSKVDPNEESQACLNELLELHQQIFDNTSYVNPVIGFDIELEILVNKYSLENGCDTPDFLIAGYILDCFKAYQRVVTARDEWFGVDMWSPDKISSKYK